MCRRTISLAIRRASCCRWSGKRVALGSALIKKPGRFCPVDYRYPPASFARAPDIAAETLYVVGGLYGNVHALNAIEELASCEAGPVDIVFNGDFHWFAATPERFAEVGRRVFAHRALRGNVE